jgi:hypothetical protein
MRKEKDAKLFSSKSVVVQRVRSFGRIQHQPFFISFSFKQKKWTTIKKKKKKAENVANKPEKPTKISVVGYGRWDSTFSVAEDNNKNAQS